PLPDAVGIEVVNEPLEFNARTYADGSVSGEFEYTQIAGGTFRFNVAVTCMNVYDGNRAKIGGIVEQSTDSDNPPGTYAWFQVFDTGQGAGAPPDQSRLVGFGHEARSGTFCNSANVHRSARAN